MSKNDWTNKLRDQLADYQEPVSRDLWAGIESSLAHQNISEKATAEKTIVNEATEATTEVLGKNARLLSIRRWSAAAAAVALLGIGGSYVYLHQNANQETGKTASSLAVNQGKTASSLAVNQKIGSSATSTSLAADYKSAERLAGDNPKMPLSRRGSADLQPLSHRSSADLQSAASSKANHDLLVEAISDASSPNSTSLAADCKSAERLAVAEQSAERLAVDNKKQQASMASNYELYDFSNSKSHGIDWSVNLYAENMVANSQSSPSLGAMVASDPSSGGQFYDNGVLVPPGDFADKTTFFAAAAPLLRASRYQKAKHHAPLSVGMQVGVGIMPRLTLSTGVVYTRTSSDFQPNGVDDYTVHQVLHYVGVPLGVNYRVWSKNGFSAYVMAGGEADFNVKNDTEDSGYKEDAKLDRPQFSAKASLGLQYDVAPQVGLYMEPGAKYYFDNGSSIENTFKDKKLNFNFQFGLRWNIGK